MLLIGAIIAIVSAIVGFVIIDQVISSQTWSNSLSGTIAGYIVPVGLLAVLGMSAYVAAVGGGGR